MPSFKLEVTIRGLSKSDMEYVISQLEGAVDVCDGNMKINKYLEYIELIKRGEDDNLELSTD